MHKEWPVLAASGASIGPIGLATRPGLRQSRAEIPSNSGKSRHAPLFRAPSGGCAMPSTLRLFISYAREDEKIADAVRAALSKALPTPLAFVDMDKYTIDVGADFAADIQDKLDKAHVLVIVYTGRAKQS